MKIITRRMFKMGEDGLDNDEIPDPTTIKNLYIEVIMEKGDPLSEYIMKTVPNPPKYEESILITSPIDEEDR